MNVSKCESAQDQSNQSEVVSRIIASLAMATFARQICLLLSFVRNDNLKPL